MSLSDAWIDRLPGRPTHDCAAVESRPGAAFTPKLQPGRCQHNMHLEVFKDSAEMAGARQLNFSAWHDRARMTTTPCNTSVRSPCSTTLPPPLRNFAPSSCPPPTPSDQRPSPARTLLLRLHIRLGLLVLHRQPLPAAFPPAPQPRSFFDIRLLGNSWTVTAA